MKEKQFKTTCFNRTHPEHFDDDTFICSHHGLVARECCIECEAKATETEKQKIQREIRLNQHLINYHLAEAGKLAVERVKLMEKLKVVEIK